MDENCAVQEGQTVPKGKPIEPAKKDPIDPAIEEQLEPAYKVFIKNGGTNVPRGGQRTSKNHFGNVYVNKRRNTARVARGFACYLCGEVASNMRDIIEHANKVHCGSEYYSCPVCGEQVSFLEAGQLQEHLLNRHVPNLTANYVDLDTDSGPMSVSPICRVSLPVIDFSSYLGRDRSMSEVIIGKKKIDDVRKKCEARKIIKKIDDESKKCDDEGKKCEVNVGEDTIDDVRIICEVRNVDGIRKKYKPRYITNNYVMFNDGLKRFKARKITNDKTDVLTKREGEAKKITNDNIDDARLIFQARKIIKDKIDGMRKQFEAKKIIQDKIDNIRKNLEARKIINDKTDDVRKKCEAKKSASDTINDVRKKCEMRITKDKIDDVHKICEVINKDQNKVKTSVTTMNQPLKKNCGYSTASAQRSSARYKYRHAIKDDVIDLGGNDGLRNMREKVDLKSTKGRTDDMRILVREVMLEKNENKLAHKKWVANTIKDNVNDVSQVCEVMMYEDKFNDVGEHEVCEVMISEDKLNDVGGHKVCEVMMAEDELNDVGEHEVCEVLMAGDKLNDVVEYEVCEVLMAEDKLDDDVGGHEVCEVLINEDKFEDVSIREVHEVIIAEDGSEVCEIMIIDDKLNYARRNEVCEVMANSKLIVNDNNYGDLRKTCEGVASKNKVIKYVSFCNEVDNDVSFCNKVDNDISFHNEVDKDVSSCNKVQNCPKTRINKGDSLPFTCDICGSKHKNPNTLSGHIKSFHTDLPAEFVCSVCFLVFATNWQLKNHIKIHGPDRWPILTKYTCYACGEAFDTEEACEQHARNAHDDCVCPVCDVVYDRGDVLQRHLYDYHTPVIYVLGGGGYVSEDYSTEDEDDGGDRRENMEAKFSCFFCSKLFAKIRSRDKHTRNAHRDEGPFICPKCNLEYERPILLQSHFFKHHVRGVPCNRHRSSLRWCNKSKYTCVFCEDAFKKQEECAAHAHECHTTAGEILYCPVCAHQFLRADELQNHLFSRHRPTKYSPYRPYTGECPICKQPTKGTYYLKRHMKKHHYGCLYMRDTKNKCAMCGVSVEKDKLTDHWTMVHAEHTSHACFRCLVVFQDEGELASHDLNFHQTNKSVSDETLAESAFNITEGTYTDDIMNAESSKNLLICLFCNDVSATEEEFMRHLNSSHADQLPYECNLCSLKFDTIKKLKYHIKSTHSEIRLEKFNAHCDICDIEFNSEVYFRKHVATHEDRFACELCVMTFATVRELEYHSLNEHTDWEVQREKSKGKPAKGYICSGFICEHCKHVYNDKNKLRNHIERTHIIGIHACEICNRAFPSIYRLEIHARSEHGYNAKRVLTKYTCFACGDAFELKEQCVTHAQEMHAYNTALICPVCFVAFERADTLQNHLFIRHTPRVIVRKRRPKKVKSSQRCNICGLILGSRNTLKSHLLNRHSKERAFTCPFCQKSFKYMHQVKNHMSIAHHEHFIGIKSDQEKAAIIYDGNFVLDENVVIEYV